MTKKQYTRQTGSSVAFFLTTEQRHIYLNAHMYVVLCFAAVNMRPYASDGQTLRLQFNCRTPHVSSPPATCGIETRIRKNRIKDFKSASAFISDALLYFR